jgi:lambda family phage tail tape measure protein
MGNTGSMTGTQAGYVPSAKGNVFDTGLQTFAKGGMFTNSVVASPTLFKFAQGTGLMGEAGPEAIMPLKRDSNGNLGVRAGGGGNVDVVVNNYSTAQAETKETVDSRGNRKIEVVIGDMTAGEISRNGSASQKAIRGTFGLQPQLIRR